MLPGPWIVVSAQDGVREEKRIIETDFRYGPWTADGPGGAFRIREQQRRYEVLI